MSSSPSQSAARAPFRRLLAAITLTTAGLLVAPPLARGFETIGFQLEVGHRDFRIHNNFGDAEANQNLAPDANFPGWYGADRAIWKGAVEWGSELRAGTGEGDPSQPNNLGSGEANFDFFFAGRALSNGAVGDDTHGEIDGCAGGVQAFTEYFNNGKGFRTRYYGCWLWVDGPEGDWQGSGGWLDLQGIATHEFGHALGLSHSADPTATMFATTSDGKSHRSLAADDIVGIQSIYGTRAPNKPHIDDVIVSGEIVTLLGFGFAPTGNDIWLTSGLASAGADPLIVEDLDSTFSGTRITFPLPAEAWSGEVLVREGPNGDRITAPFPLDLGRCAAPSSYCVTTPNSVGPGAVLAATGSRSVSREDFTLRVAGSVPNQYGLFFYGAQQAQIPVGNGTLCVASPFFRLPVVQATPSGQASFTLRFGELMGNGVIEAGSTWNFQWWYRDPAAGGSKYDFSDAVQVEFCP